MRSSKTAVYAMEFLEFQRLSGNSAMMAEYMKQIILESTGESPIELRGIFHVKIA